MFAREVTTLKILSFLVGDLESALHARLNQVGEFEYRHAQLPPSSAPDRALLTDAFWSQSSIDAADVVLVGLNGEELTRLRKQLASKRQRRSLAGRPWGWAPAAVIVVLADVHPRDVELAAELEFDAILSAPFESDVICQRFKAARQRCQRRRHQLERHGKMRQLCRGVNRKRRLLRDKVDLLCQDLVNSNMQFTETLRGLRHAYDFQSSLTGQFDLRYLLYRALRELKLDIPDSSAALYLCASDHFEAHVAAPWYQQSTDIPEIEQAFRTTAVEQVIQTRHSLLVTDAGQWPQISAPQRRLLSGLSVLALPVAADGELLGIVVLYRQATQPLGDREHKILLPLMQPLAKAIAAVQKLQPLII